MTEISNRETAKIYEFPTRARATKSVHQENRKRVADLGSMRVAYAECGSGWYHEAALQDAEPARKR
jgi:uncharacterized protein DUF2735